MGKLLRDFCCQECHTSVERFVDSSLSAVPCEYGGTANRMIGMPRVSLEGITGDFPGAADRWARIREDNARIKASKRQE